jgi:hypothetical protein
MTLDKPVLALLCTLTPIGLSAQDSLVHATVDSGTVVRMHRESGPPVLGRLVQPLTPSSVLLLYCPYPAGACKGASDTLAIQRTSTASLTGLEVQHGDYFAEGLIFGGLIGALFGTFVGATANAVCDGDTGPFMCSYSPGTYALVSAIAYALIVGSTGAKTPRWKPAP